MIMATLPNMTVSAVESEKRKRFLRVAGKRVTVALKALSVLERTWNVLSYEFKPVEAERTIAALEAAVDRVRTAIAGKPQLKEGFFDERD